LVVNAASTGAALTFDDGPDPVWTPRILEALREADATATFFVSPSRSRSGIRI
jgi:peptidoglycan/xylan/chitin deacetylase (PgdA/CDA1 family)